MRIFNNVGNALFAIERIRNLTFVYDCGGKNIGIIEKAIKTNFDEKNEIEAVFISHYDSDHINGLHFLLKRCNVKKLILPMMSDAYKIVLLFLYDIEADLARFILNPTAYVEEISPETKVFYVYDTGEDLFQNDNRTMTLDELSQSLRDIPSGTKLTSEKLPHWVLIPMCIEFLSKEQNDIFIKELVRLLGLSTSEYSIDIKQLWKDYDLCNGKKTSIGLGDKVTKNKIKKALKKAVPKLDSKRINEASQTLYSGPDDTVNFPRIGCLYLGDYNAKKNWKKLDLIYGPYQKNIRIVQVPHHGSEECFNDNLIELGTIAVVSAALDGRIAINNTIARIVKRGGIPLATGSRGDVCIKSHFFVSYILPDLIEIY